MAAAAAQGQQPRAHHAVPAGMYPQLAHQDDAAARRVVAAHRAAIARAHADAVRASNCGSRHVGFTLIPCEGATEAAAISLAVEMAQRVDQKQQQVLAAAAAAAAAAGPAAPPPARASITAESPVVHKPMQSGREFALMFVAYVGITCSGPTTVANMPSALVSFMGEVQALAAPLVVASFARFTLGQMARNLGLPQAPPGPRGPIVFTDTLLSRSVAHIAPSIMGVFPPSALAPLPTSTMPPMLSALLLRFHANVPLAIVLDAWERGELATRAHLRAALNAARGVSAGAIPAVVAYLNGLPAAAAPASVARRNTYVAALAAAAAAANLNPGNPVAAAAAAAAVVPGGTLARRDLLDGLSPGARVDFSAMRGLQHVGNIGARTRLTANVVPEFVSVVAPATLPAVGGDILPDPAQPAPGTEANEAQLSLLGLLAAEGNISLNGTVTLGTAALDLSLHYEFGMMCSPGGQFEATVRVCMVENGRHGRVRGMDFGTITVVHDAPLAARMGQYLSVGNHKVNFTQNNANRIRALIRNGPAPPAPAQPAPPAPIPAAPVERRRRRGAAFVKGFIKGDGYYSSRAAVRPSIFSRTLLPGEEDVGGNVSAGVTTTNPHELGLLRDCIEMLDERLRVSHMQLPAQGNCIDARVPGRLQVGLLFAGLEAGCRAAPAPGRAGRLATAFGVSNAPITTPTDPEPCGVTHPALSALDQPRKGLFVHRLGLSGANPRPIPAAKVWLPTSAALAAAVAGGAGGPALPGAAATQPSPAMVAAASAGIRSHNLFSFLLHRASGTAPPPMARVAAAPRRDLTLAVCSIPVPDQADRDRTRDRRLVASLAHGLVRAGATIATGLLPADVGSGLPFAAGRCLREFNARANRVVLGAATAATAGGNVSGAAIGEAMNAAVPAPGTATAATGAAAAAGWWVVPLPPAAAPAPVPPAPAFVAQADAVGLGGGKGAAGRSVVKLTAFRRTDRVPMPRYVEPRGHEPGQWVADSVRASYPRDGFFGAGGGGRVGGRGILVSNVTAQMCWWPPRALNDNRPQGLGPFDFGARGAYAPVVAQAVLASSAAAADVRLAARDVVDLGPARGVVGAVAACEGLLFRIAEGALAAAAAGLAPPPAPPPLSVAARNSPEVRARLLSTQYPVLNTSVLPNRLFNSAPAAALPPRFVVFAGQVPGARGRNLNRPVIAQELVGGRPYVDHRGRQKSRSFVFRDAFHLHFPPHLRPVESVVSMAGDEFVPTALDGADVTRVENFGTFPTQGASISPPGVARMLTQAGGGDHYHNVNALWCQRGFGADDLDAALRATRLALINRPLASPAQRYPAPISDARSGRLVCESGVDDNRGSYMLSSVLAVDRGAEARSHPILSAVRGQRFVWAAMARFDPPPVPLPDRDAHPAAYYPSKIFVSAFREFFQLPGIEFATQQSTRRVFIASPVTALLLAIAEIVEPATVYPHGAGHKSGPQRVLLRILTRLVGSDAEAYPLRAFLREGDEVLVPLSSPVLQVETPTQLRARLAAHAAGTMPADWGSTLQAMGVN